MVVFLQKSSGPADDYLFSTSTAWASFAGRTQGAQRCHTCEIWDQRTYRATGISLRRAAAGSHLPGQYTGR